jgi:hypothetical protein
MHLHGRDMFIVTEADAAAIREVFDREGELSATIELRRRFPGISDNEQARACTRSIANWKPLPPPSELPRRRRVRREPKQPA